MAVICANCAYSIVDEGKIAAVKIAQRGEKFDRVAWQKNYIREYMRKKRAKDKDKLK